MEHTTNEMTYEQTIELEENIKLKNKANKIYDKFINNVKLNPRDYCGSGKFKHWADKHNTIYIILKDDKFNFCCNFLNEYYNIEVTPAGIFNALKCSSRGIEHLEAHVNNF